jgi:mannose-6-phosphate isomerase-like protein (cupin superfamily)
VAGYTKLNLTEDVDDSAQKFGMGEVLQAHFAREAIEAQKFGLSLQRLKPNQRMPFGHRHAEQEEVYVVVGGSGRLKVEDEVLELAQWDAVRVDPELVRNLEAGPDGLDVIAFGAPGVRDTEQLMNWWTD